MNILDVVIVLAAIAYGIGGFRSGAVVGLFSLAGFFGGAILGSQLAGPLGDMLASGRGQIPIAIVCVLVLATLGQLLGVYIAGHLKERFVRGRGRPVDHSIGAALGVISVLLVAWMVAVPLASSPYPSLASEASHSRIVRAVNGAVPSTVRGLYSSLRRYLDQSGFPPVLGDFPSTSNVPVPEPPKSLTPAQQQTVNTAQRSILKIFGSAPECGRGTEGSGFVYARHRVLTNAHVVAGSHTVSVQVPGSSGTQPATVVVFDPNRDVAVLDVPTLNAPPLRLASTPAKRGQPAVVLGYPENGPFTIRAARVRGQQTVRGSNIYGNTGVTRQIYSVRAVVRSGNSGGPLLAFDGTVLGIVFATALDIPETGFVLTNEEISGRAAEGRTATGAVSTQGCTPE